MPQLAKTGILSDDYVLNVYCLQHKLESILQNLPADKLNKQYINQYIKKLPLTKTQKNDFIDYFLYKVNNNLLPPKINVLDKIKLDVVNNVGDNINNKSTDILQLEFNNLLEEIKEDNYFNPIKRQLSSTSLASSSAYTEFTDIPIPKQKDLTKEQYDELIKEQRFKRDTYEAAKEFTDITIRRAVYEALPRTRGRPPQTYTYYVNKKLGVDEAGPSGQDQP